MCLFAECGFFDVLKKGGSLLLLGLSGVGLCVGGRGWGRVRYATHVDPKPWLSRLIGFLKFALLWGLCMAEVDGVVTWRTVVVCGVGLML